MVLNLSPGLVAANSHPQLLLNWLEPTLKSLTKRRDGKYVKMNTKKTWDGTISSNIVDPDVGVSMSASFLNCSSNLSTEIILGF